MKAVQIVKPNDLRIIDMDKPTIDAKNNVLVKIKAAGICGSDVGIYHGTNAAATYPRVIGHEIVGVVEEVVSGASLSGCVPRHRGPGHCLRHLLCLPQGPSQCL